MFKFQYQNEKKRKKVGSGKKFFGSHNGAIRRLQVGAGFRDYKSGQEGLQIGGSFTDFKSGQKDYKSELEFQIGENRFQIRAELQIGEIEISNRDRDYKPVKNILKTMF